MTTLKSPFLRAAEASLREELTYVAEVRSTIRARFNLNSNALSGKKIAEAIDHRYYLGIAHHSIIVADFNMVADVPHGMDIGGFLVKINFFRIKEVTVPEEHVNEKQFSIQLNDFDIYDKHQRAISEYEMSDEQKTEYKIENKIPLLIYFETESRKTLLEQYSIAYATSKMYHELLYIRPVIKFISKEIFPDMSSDDRQQAVDLNDMATPELSKLILKKPSAQSSYHCLRSYGFYTSSHFQSLVNDNKFRSDGIYGWVDPTNQMLNAQRPFFTLTYSEQKKMIYEHSRPEDCLKMFVRRITFGKEYRVAKKMHKVPRVKEVHRDFLYQHYNIRDLDISEWNALCVHVRILGYVDGDDVIDDIPLVPIHYLTTNTAEFLDIQDRFRDVVIYYIRRKYIPPDLEDFQDIVLCYRCEQTMWYNREEVFGQLAFLGDEKDELSGPHQIMKSLHSLNAMSDPSHYMRLAQQRANALMLPFSSYGWYRETLDIYPQYKEGMMFCLCVLNILESYGFTSTSAIEISEEEFKQAGTNPMEYAFALEDSMPSVEPMKLNIAYIRAWKRRCWEYLSVTVDEGYPFEDLSIQSIVSVFQTLNGETRVYSLLQEILDRFVYLRKKHGTKYVYKPLVSMLRDTKVIFSRKITFNVSVMTKLLNYNYFYCTFRRLDTTLQEYAQMLTRLLFVSPSGVSAMKNAKIELFKESICRCISTLAPVMKTYKGPLDYHSSVTTGDSMEYRTEISGRIEAMDPLLYVEIVFPVLIRIVFDCPVSNKIYAFKALSNLCSNPQAFLMTKIVHDLHEQGLMMYTVKELLADRDDALCISIVEFLDNLVQNEEALHILVDYEIIQYILQLLIWKPKKSPTYKKDGFNPQPFRNLRLLSSSVSILKRITSNQQYRKLLLDPQKDKRNAEFTLEILFSLIHKSNIAFVTGTASSDTSVMSTLVVNVLGVLHNLATDYEVNKKFLGPRVIPVSIDLLETSASQAVILAALKVVLSISLEPTNCEYLRGEKMIAKLYPGLQKLMKGMKRVDPLRIHKFEETLARCGEISEFKVITNEIHKIVFD